MELNSKQKEVDDWIKQYGGYWSPLSMFARLVEETGELGRKMNHVYGMKKRRGENQGDWGWNWRYFFNLDNDLKFIKDRFRKNIWQNKEQN